MTGEIAICRRTCFQALSGHPPLAIGGLLVIFSFSATIPAATVESIRLTLDSVQAPLWRAHGVSIELTFRGREHAELRLHAERLELPWPVDSLADIRLVCLVAIEVQEIACKEGTLALQSAVLDAPHLNVAFRYGVSDGTLAFTVADGPVADGTLAVEGRLAGQRWDLHVQGVDLRAQRLSEALRALSLWPDGYVIEHGRLSTTARIRGEGASVVRLEAKGRVAALAFDGPSAGEDVNAEYDFTLERGAAGWVAEVEGALTQGLVFIEPGLKVGSVSPGFTFDVQGDPLRLHVAAEWNAEAKELSLSHGFLDHPGVVRADGAALLSLGSDSPVQMLTLRAAQAQMGPLYETYLQPLLISSSFNALSATGQIDLEIKLDSGRLSEILLGFEHVEIRDTQGRFGITDVNGSFAFSSASEPRLSELRWGGASLYRLDFGAGSLAAITQDRSLRLVGDTFIPFLDGGLRIDTLAYQQAAPDEIGLEFGGVLTPVSLEAFCRAMDWPILSGKVSGIIPGLHYKDKALTIDGKVLVRAFDGDVVVHNLVVVDLFGTVPVLDTDIDFKGLDLEPLTQAFSFGRIEGRLGGVVRQLRMEDWQPVSFNASFYTPEGDQSRHRISRKAIDNLTTLGGGGASTAISNTFIGVFKEFSYDRLGLSCRLSNGVCEMGGVGPVNGGYYIVKRGLLPPWIDVKGFNREVDWAVLVDRLMVITQGGSPVIN